MRVNTSIAGDFVFGFPVFVMKSDCDFAIFSV